MKFISWGWFMNSGVVPHACFEWFCKNFGRHEEVTLGDVLGKMYETCPIQQEPYDKWIIGLLAWSFEQDQLTFARGKIVGFLAEWLEPVLPKVYPSLGDPKIVLGILKDYSAGTALDIDKVRMYKDVFRGHSREETQSQKFIRPAFSLVLEAILHPDDKTAYGLLAQAVIHVAYAHTDLEGSDDEAIIAGMRKFILEDVVPVIQQL